MQRFFIAFFCKMCYNTIDRSSQSSLSSRGCCKENYKGDRNMSIYAFVAIIVIVVVLSFFNEKVTKLPNEIALMLFSTVVQGLTLKPVYRRISRSVQGNAQ